jgi:hypothetical protein
MKKIFVAMMMLFIWTSYAFGAGSCVFTSKQAFYGESGNIDKVIVRLTCTGDGSITAYSFDAKTFDVLGFYLYSVTTDPGTSAPTDNYDITLVVSGEDVSGGLLADRSTSATQTKIICPENIGYHIMDNNDVAITFANNTANPSTIVMDLEFVKN